MGTALAMGMSTSVDARSLMLGLMVFVWAARLGYFLFTRIHKAGKDARFDAIKTCFVRFLAAWTLQGLWITFTAAAAWGAITSEQKEPFGIFAMIGSLVWLSGFIIEVVADRQKGQFKEESENKGKFIRSGLWSRSRHPNYFGEIVLWTGVAIIAFPVLQGWQWVFLSSPVFITILLTRVSGIPLLEKRADDTWGGQEDYEAYKKSTPVLVPRFR
jgi:steroid 5-alpha reductase family enzyme